MRNEARDRRCRFTYDKNGNGKTMCDSRGLTVYFYDVMSRLVRVVEPEEKWIAYEYDGNGNRTKMTTHSDSPAFEHVTEYSYYDNGLLYQVTNQLDGVTTYTYKDNGLVDTITYPNSTKAVHTYNSRNWLTCISNRKSDDTIIAEFTYTYDPTYWGKNGTRTRVIENILKPDNSRISAQVDYEYDDLYRLVHEHRIAYNGGDPGVAYEYNFAYDDAGNRTQWQIVGGTTTNYTYDAANKMTSPGTFTYDDKGNTRTETNGSIVTTYTWDPLNRLTQWQKTGETTQTYIYNADGMRVRVTPSGGTATEFVLDSGEVAEEISGQTATAYARPGLVSQISGTTRTIYYADAIGSTRTMGGEDQTVTRAIIYDAYGNVRYSSPDSPGEFGFAGKYRYQTDSVGFYYIKHRYYDSTAGRFISRDPAEDEMNLYSYVSNRPTAGIDRFGLAWEGSPDLGDPRGTIIWPGILTGCSAIGSACTFGCWGGGRFADDPGFGGSRCCAYVAIGAGAAAGGCAVTVTTWAPVGATPTICAGRWVMVGSPNWWTYIRSGVWQPGWMNGLCGGSYPYPYNNYLSCQINGTCLRWPGGWEWWKGLIGQRIVKGW